MCRIFRRPRDDRAVQEREILFFGVRNAKRRCQCTTNTKCGATRVGNRSTRSGDRGGVFGTHLDTELRRIDECIEGAAVANINGE